MLCPSVDLLISIHAPPRGATAPTPQLGGITIFQFTPLREGRLATSESPGVGKISIHAPPRGATVAALTEDGDELISIHAPPRGATEWADFTGDFFRISIHAPPRGATAGRIDAPGFFDISIHAPPRGATGTGGRTASALDDFNSRPSARGDAQGDSARAEHCVHFNSRPSARGDPIRPVHPRVQGYFNSRPSARGDKSCPNRTATSSLFQFTPLREGRHPLHECNTEGIFISIHAPPRGATCEAAPQHRYLFLFQFTPLREGRRHEGIHEREPSHFNSRPSARGDNMDSGWDFTALISIHAPPRGATSARIAIYCRDIFQFTPLREGRLLRLGMNGDEFKFQFTPLREGRLPPLVRPCGITNFNSRPSARGDGGIRAPRPGRLHFNSRPSARGDCADVRDGAVTDISIHAPPRGATCCGVLPCCVFKISIHAPPRGATCSLCPQRRFRAHFNSRPSARGDVLEEKQK